ncbi:MAG: class I SAM-dependent methyltransferase [Solirubrobacteraceae bacterium]|nr:class I SAM-dependent methyltransferase [Solirubrobacteraceae bacterium]
MASLQNERTNAGYFEQGRDDVIALLPQGVERVLDVGCGAGATARGLRAKGATTLHGIELVEEAGKTAEQQFDRVLIGSVEEKLAELEGPYDAVLCLDLLEHLADPYSVLEELRKLTREGGYLLVSLPNARNLMLVKDLVFRGTFGYTPHGHRDWTHLRWFTRKDAVKAFADAGFEVIKTGTPPPRPWRRYTGMTTKPALELTTFQWYFLAQAR